MQEIILSKIISLNPSDIIGNKNFFSNLCERGCKVYSKKWSCPPYSPTHNIKQESQLIILWMNNNIISKNEYTKVKAINSILRSRLYKLLSLYPNTLVYGSGSCKLCKKCNYPNPCKHPDKFIYSMESVGIDVNSICASVGHNLIWYHKGKPYKYGTVVGLIITNNKEKIENQLKEILNPIVLKYSPLPELL